MQKPGRLSRPGVALLSDNLTLILPGGGAYLMTVQRVTRRVYVRAASFFPLPDCAAVCPPPDYIYTEKPEPYSFILFLMMIVEP